MTFQELVNQVKVWEGFRSERYLCPSGVPTIGYGFTASQFSDHVVPLHMSKDEADVMLTNVMYKWVNDVLEELRRMGYTQKECDILLYPLTDFAYNCGMGNLIQLCADGWRSVSEIIEKIVLYNKSAGKVLNGLVKRREWERDEIKKLYNVKVPPTYTAKDVQEYLNEMYGENLVVDGILGRESIKAIMKALRK